MFEMIDTATAFNNVFLERINTAEGQEKVAEAGLAFVRTRLREIAFNRRILPPQNVTRADCQRAVDHDSLCIIRDIEPDSTAVVLTYRGRSPDKYLNGKRYAITFHKIASERFHKNEQELLAYDYPITKVVEENSLKDLQFVEDSEFMKHVDSGISVTGKHIESSDTAVNRKALIQMCKMIDGDKLQSQVLLMTNVDWDDWQIMPATDVGSPLASEVVVSGYKYDTILNRRLIVTNKTEIVPPGRVYAFADPAYLGHSFLFGDAHFWIKKEADMISWETWYMRGAGIANIRAMASIQLDVPAIFPINGSL